MFYLRWWLSVPWFTSWLDLIVGSLFGYWQVEIILEKSEHFDELMAAAAEERELAPEGDQVEPWRSFPSS